VRTCGQGENPRQVSTYARNSILRAQCAQAASVLVRTAHANSSCAQERLQSLAILLVRMFAAGIDMHAALPDLSFLDAPRSQPRTEQGNPRPSEMLLLVGLEPWDRNEAIRLMAAADELPSRYGVSGAHPDILRAAAMVVSAFQTRDIGTVRFAVAEFAVEVRRVAGALPGSGIIPLPLKSLYSGSPVAAPRSSVRRSGR
jgi:hypothetical protein